MQALEVRLEAARLFVAIRIEQRIALAKTRCGIPTQLSDVCSSEDAIRAMKSICPRFAVTIRIEGRRWEYIDDQHPSIGRFSVDTCRTETVRPYSSIEDVRRQAESIFDDYAALEDDEFTPTRCYLRDQFGGTLAEYDLKGWFPIGALPRRASWPDIERHIEELSSHAAFEGGWDNFETARRMRADAHRCAQRLHMAQVQDKIF